MFPSRVWPQGALLLSWLIDWPDEGHEVIYCLGRVLPSGALEAAKAKRLFNLVCVFGWCHSHTSLGKCYCLTVRPMFSNYILWAETCLCVHYEAKLSVGSSCQYSSICACMNEYLSKLFDKFAYLKKSQGKGMSKMIHGGQQNSTVVSIQVHTGDQMKLGIHPVESSARQIWKRKELLMEHISSTLIIQQMLLI